VTLLHSSGAKVIHGDWDDTGGLQVDASLSASQSSGTGQTTFVKTDVTDYDSVVNLFDVAWKKYGRVDIAISNAGIQEIGNWFDPGLDLNSVKTVSLSFSHEASLLNLMLITSKQKPPTKVLDVNLTGTLYFARVAAVYLKQGSKPNEDKSLILVSSTAGFKETPGLFTYTASKHGILGLMRSLRPYLPKTHNIHINTICPWFTDTVLAQGVKENWLKAGLPVNTPEDVGRVMLEVAVGKDGKGRKWNGTAVFVEGGNGLDIEEGINATEEQWLGREVSRTLNRGQEVLGDGTDWLPENKH
jgi:NAD(P)-dependent dehydrogenase (short-subunit alcohol dehydrogenase family)